jgi:twitching motility protein PilJ
MKNGFHTQNNSVKSESKSATLKTLLTTDIHQALLTGITIKQPIVPTIQKSLFQRFYNLSINRKQLIILIASELVFILGIGIVVRWLTTSNLQNISLEQAESEIAVADIIYNIKINQMSFSLRGQSENPTIIKAASLHNSGQTLKRNLKAEIKEILSKEIKTHKIEYLTLVGKNLKIISHTNNNRIGEVFNPDNLVSDVFNNPQQIKASRIISWSELSKESPLFVNRFSNQNVLIRYTVTPVKDPDTQAVIGALVSGDIVNGKDAIVRDILKTTGGGYSAIYLRQPTGEFTLVTALNQRQSQYSNQAATRIELTPAGSNLLATAAASEGKTVTTKVKVGNQNYAIAAKAVPNKILEIDDGRVSFFGENPVGILVRGTPETALNQMQQNSWYLELFTIILALAIAAISTLILRRAIVKPIQELKQAAQKFTQGDRLARSEVFATDEVGQLATTFNAIAASITAQIRHEENTPKIAQIVDEITSRFRGSLNTLHILNVAVSDIREAIHADRVIVYRFDENWEGKIVAESVGTDWPIALGTQIADPCFAQDYVIKYQRGRVQALENIYTSGLTECHLNQLEQFAVQANLVAPILINNKLYGLLIAHQCSGPRQWQDLEINLLKQVTIPVGYALEQAALLEQVDRARSLAEAAAVEQHQQHEALRQQIIKLLSDIEGAYHGNLTVHSVVTSGELASVAEFFNSIVENLRAIVTKVKVSASQVNTAIGDNEASIRQLAAKALKQANDISLTLASVDNMTLAIQTLAENAQTAAQVTHSAILTAQESGAVMELTVQNILELRSTISDTGKKVKRLGESSQEISQIVCLISQIAMQTRLLAINAGLEAERAGVKNQSFVLIAEEVDQLAARCTNATQEIEQIVEKIQLETNEVVTAMEQGTIQVVEGSHIVEDAKMALSQILNVSCQIDELVQSISQVSGAQLETSQVVSQLMREISQLSEFTSTSSHEISESLQQTVEISQELQETVEIFKVS